MTISQERTAVTSVTANRAEFATNGARRGHACPWLVQGEVTRPDGVRETLYIIAEPTDPRQQGTMGTKFVAAIRDVYAASTHSDPILALTAAIEAANDALYHSNRTATPGARLFLGLTCLVVREQDLIICQVSPTQLLLAQNGAPVILPSFDTWRADYQPRGPENQQGLGATETATPALFRAIIEEGDLIILCSSNLARLLATDDEGELGPLLGSDPQLAIEHLRELAERNGFDPAYAMAITPVASFAAASPEGDVEAEGWDDHEDTPAEVSQSSERWLERSLREMRDWSGIIPWPRRGGGRVVPLRQSRRVGALPDAEIDDERRDEALDGDDVRDNATFAPRQQDARVSVASEVDYDEADAAHDDYYDDLEDELDESPEVQEPRQHAARVAGQPARRRGGIGQALGAVVAFVVLVFGSVLERVLPPGGRRQNERFLERSRSRVWPLGNLERHRGGKSRIGRFLPLVAAAILIATILVLTLSVRNRQIQNEAQQFDNALAQIAQQRDAAVAMSDKLAAYNRLLALPASLTSIEGADKPGRPERIATEQAAILVAIDQVAGVTRLPAANVEIAATLPSGAVPVSGRPQLVASDGQQFALVNGTVYSVDGRSKALVRLLGKGDTINGISIGQIVGIAWRIDALIAFTETHGFVRNGNGWSTMPLAATGHKATAVESFDGNLYFLEAERGQIVKFTSGAFAQSPQPWTSTNATADLGLAVDLAIDADIYTLLSDGRVLDYYQGQVKTSFAPSTVPPLAGASAITIAPEGRWLYLIDPQEGRIVRLARDGSINGIYKPVAGGPSLASVRDIAVDGSTGALHLLTDTEVITVRLP